MHTVSKRGLAIAAITMAAILLAACGDAAETTTTNAPSDVTSSTAPSDVTSSTAPSDVTSSTAPAPATVRVAVTSFQQEQIAKWMAPKATLAYIGPMYDPLIAPGPDGSPSTDGIINDWELNAEDGVLTLQVRSGVKFHNGDEVTAEDVKFSLEVAADPSSSSTSGGQLRSSVDRIEVTGPNSLDLHLIGPQPTLINVLSWVEGDVVVIPKEYIEGLEGSDLAKAEAFSEAPIGTGPWKYVTHAFGQSIEFEANTEYFRPDRVPQFQGLILLSVAEPTTRQNMLLAGEVDVIDAQAEQAGQLADDGYQPYLVLKVAHAIVSFLKSYDEMQITNDVRIREALALAVDREALVSALFPELPGVGAAATVSNGAALTGPGIAGYREDFETYPYDPERARQLLEDAGYYDDPETILAWQYSVSEFPTAPDVMEGIAAFWEAIDVQVELRPTDPGALVEKLQADDPPLDDNDVVTWPPSYRPTGLNNLRVFATSKELGNLMVSPIPYEIDEMVLRISAIADPDDFDTAMAELWQTLYDEVWAIPIAWLSKTVVVNPDVVADYSPLDLQGDFAAWETLVPAQAS